ncbi:MAG: glycosyltransferase family 4 protein, partial [Bacilli bacterium]
MARSADMRIGLLTYGMDRELTGIGRYAAELCYALRDIAPQTEIILLNPYPHSQLPLYRDFPAYSVPWLAKLPGVLAVGSVVLGLAARHLKLDILHDPCGIAPFVFPRLGGLRRVVTIHDAIPYVYPRVQPLLTRVTFRTLIPASRVTADAVLTDSLSARGDLVRHVGFHEDRITAIYPGTRCPAPHELAAWRSRRDSVLVPLGVKKPFFLYVGGLNPRKNIPTIMRAFASLADHGLDMQLAVVGPKTWMSQGVFDKAKELAESVVLTGYVDEDTLHVLYANTTAVVYPSLYEGFGLPPL